jgi:hypothetical protein
MKRKPVKPKMVRLPKDFHWKVLNAHLQDVETLLPDQVVKELRHLVAQRDVAGYLEFCDNVISLQKYKYKEMDIASLRALRSLAMLQKLPFSSSDDLDDPAYEKFFWADNRCTRMNLNRFPQGCINEELFEGPVFEHARTFCHMVLDVPANPLMLGRHGPGSNLSTVKQRTSTFDKYQPPLTVTAAAAPLLRATIMSDQRWFRALLAHHFRDPRINLMGYSPKGHNSILRYFHVGLTDQDRESFWDNILEVVTHNRIATVPKNARTNRMIAIEPAGNVYLQLGVDAIIRQRLKRFSIDLDRGQNKNRSLAQLGSVNDSNVTIDLSAASDTISLAVVKYLLPNNWYSLLLKLRSPFGEWNTGRCEYDRLSSMGNGYTFVIESLVFASILYGVIKAQGDRWNENTSELAIYGDDIICPRKYANDLMFCLRRAGFVVNADKSFQQGFIRESCGGDYYKGMDIRPIYISRLINTEHEALIVHNLIFRWFDTHMSKHFPRRHLGSLFDKYLRNTDIGPVDADCVTKWRFSYNAEPIYNSAMQMWGYVINCYEQKRRPFRAPYWLRACYQGLCNTLSHRPPPSYDFVKVKRIEEGSNPYALIGRNSPIQQYRKTRFVPA